jgi:hypothetical protein
MALLPDDDPVRFWSVRRRGRLVLPRHLDRIVVQATEFQDDQWRSAHSVAVRWADLESSGRITRINEAQLKGQFLNDIFGTALGFIFVSANLPQWDLQPEYAVNGGSADAAVGAFAQFQTPSPRALVEVKGPQVSLDRDRSQGRTPVQQLWDYLNSVPECPWGVLTNMVSFRLYHRAKTTYYFEHFTLQSLRGERKFREFYALFSRLALLARTMGQTPWADQLLADAAQQQKTVGDELYKEYSAQRLSLIHHLHEQCGKTVDGGIRIAQKLLDRIVFIAFCEDRELLPERTIDKAWRQEAPFAHVTNPRWTNFLELFRSVDQGHTRSSIPAYNGGLFRADSEVDDLQLDDEWTDFFKGVGEYDFRDEVNVEVLGHLFERSITELEKLRVGDLFAVPLPRRRDKTAAMPKSAQRKRFGIYYTPPEFTDLIVRHTIDVVLDERFDRIARALDFEPDDPASCAQRDSSPEYSRKCLEILRDLKVCDPACGSGAFLFRAYERLEERYDEVIEKLRHLGDAEAESLVANIPDMILAGNLFGVDLSEEAVEITRLALWIATARKGRTLADLSANIVCGNSLVDDPNVDPKALNWQATFPAVFQRPDAGFDCVIGNPPWERLKVQDREFFSLSAPDIAAAVSAADRRKKIAILEKKNVELYSLYTAAKARADRALSYARGSGRYPLTGKGDVNTYMLFSELARTIVAPTGRVGLLVPSGIATDDTTKDFFKELMDSKSLMLLYDFENKRPFFPDVHRSFKFSTMVIGGSAVRHEHADFVFFARDFDNLKDKKRHIPLTSADMALLNPNTKTCPIFRTRRDAELTKRIYKRVPILIDEDRESGGNPWSIKFVRMFEQDPDAELFQSADDLRPQAYKLRGNVWTKKSSVFLPLYEAKMVQAFDHRAASVVVEKGNWVRKGQTVETSLVHHQNPEFCVQPRWWIDRTHFLEATRNIAHPAYLCFKRVTSPTNQRTFIASFVPAVPVVHTAPLIIPESNITARLSCCLLGNINSFILDYVTRQKIGNIELSFFIISQLPLFPPDKYAERCPWNQRQTLERWISDRVLKLTCTANDMLPLAKAAGFKKGVHKWKEEERAELMAELDAAYFHLYELSREDAEYVLSTFSGTEDAEGVFAPRGTSQMILNFYDQLSAR